ncbi:hypothetical protein D7Y11_01485 [Corallococcus sp. AB018]|uniref:hypothetical protein n=1 Tax=Corallococcus sp. AB018 TaxID=2316715 RepID=UPI000F890E27|nr:hypothetical protein [Corallococcus sp. AB018]RUO94985.1 hypothetical protein D7Y11_01485 [Corallococcus sp. AB018]
MSNQHSAAHALPHPLLHLYRDMADLEAMERLMARAHARAGRQARHRARIRRHPGVRYQSPEFTVVDRDLGHILESP